MATASLEIGLNNPEDSSALLSAKFLPALEQPSSTLADSQKEMLEGPEVNFEIAATSWATGLNVPQETSASLSTVLLPALEQESQPSPTVLSPYLWGPPPPPYPDLSIPYQYLYPLDSQVVGTGITPAQNHF
jgi:hypothetical protein